MKDSNKMNWDEEGDHDVDDNDDSQVQYESELDDDNFYENDEQMEIAQLR